MRRRTFFGFVKSKLRYTTVDETLPEPVAVAPSERVTLFFDQPYIPGEKLSLHPGDPVKKGERLSLTKDAGGYALAPKSGRIENISGFLGIGGRRFTTVTLAIDDEAHQTLDEGFKSVYQSPSLKNAREFLAGLPGKPNLEVFFNPQRPVKSIVVLGVDSDLVGVTNQYFVNNAIVAIKTGIDTLRQISGIHEVILVVPHYLFKVAGAAGATIKTVDSAYPSAHPELIMRYILSEQSTPDVEPPSDDGVAVFTAEAVVAIGSAYKTGFLPLEKIVCFVSKDETRRLISVPIGTPVKDIAEAFHEPIGEGDRVIFGGPMTGVSVYSDNHPVLADTNTIMIQDRRRIPEVRDNPCTNCGACVRVCPVNVPVNMLIRFLQAGRYEEAVSQCDLNCCIECGFCSYVCEARIPIFQYIHLAKLTLAGMNPVEKNNG